MTEVILWIISGLLAFIVILIKMVWVGLQKKIDEMITTQGMFIKEVVDIKEDIAQIMSWQKSHEKRLDKLER